MGRCAMNTYEETLRNEVVYDLGSEVIEMFKKAAKLHGDDPHIIPMLAAALTGAIRELDKTTPRLQEYVHNAIRA